jgi:hypothetical protein
VRGNVALVDRGTCDFVTKARNVQAAGAIGMVVADNQPGDVAGMSGSDPTIAIPSVRVTQANGVTIKASLQRRSRTQSGVVASLGVNPTRWPAPTRRAGSCCTRRPSTRRARRCRTTPPRPSRTS